MRPGQEALASQPRGLGGGQKGWGRVGTEKPVGITHPFPSVSRVPLYMALAAPTCSEGRAGSLTYDVSSRAWAILEPASRALGKAEGGVREHFLLAPSQRRG